MESKSKKNNKQKDNKIRKIIIAIIILILLLLALFSCTRLKDDSKGEKDFDTQESDKVQTEDVKEEIEEVVDQYNQKEELDKVFQNKDNSYELALKAVLKAEDKVTEDTYNKALDLVNKVTDENGKNSLLERLEEVKNGIKVKSLVSTLEDKTNSASNKKEMDYARKYNTDEDIKNLVDNLSNKKLKKELKTRLSKIYKLLNDNEITIDIEDGAILNSDTEILIEDENEVVLILNDEEVENGIIVSDGVYTLTVKDAAFNEKTIKFTVDTIAPSAKVVEIYGNTETLGYAKVGDEIYVGIVADEELGELPTIKINGVIGEEVKEELTEEGHLYYVKAIMTEEMEEGEIQFTIEGYKDLAGNEGKVLTNENITTELEKIILDKTAPVGIVTYSTEEFINGKVTVTITFEEEIGPVDGWNLSSDKKVLTKELDDNEISSVEVKDLAGNISQIDYEVSNIDKKFPRIPNVENDKHYPEIAPIIEDENLASVTLNGIPFKSGTKIRLNGSYTLVAKDLAGNTTEVSFVVDNIAPIILVLDQIDFIQSDIIPIKPVILDANLDTVVITKDGEDINYQQGDQLTEPGKYEIVAKDLAGNTSSTTFTIDNSGPVLYNDGIIPTLLQGGVFKEVKVKVYEENFDEDSIILLKKSTINLPFDYTIPTYKRVDYTYGDTITEEGEYIVLATDKALNVSFAKFIIDTSNPTVNVEDGKYYSSVQLNVTDVSLLATIVSKKSSYGMYIPTTIQNGDTITEDGEYKVIATDRVGNTTEVEFVIDSKFPEITGVKEGYIYKEVEPVISDANLDKVVVTKDGNIIELSNKYTLDGNYNITATDLAGNTTEVNFEINKNVLNVENISDGAYYNSEVQPEITNLGQISISLVKDGKEVPYEKNDTIKEEGNYTLTVVDEYENKIVVNFIIDKTASTIYAESKQVPASKDSSLNVLATVKDNIDPDKTILPTTITHSSGKEVVLIDNKISTSKEWLGTYTLVYETTDNALNPISKTITIEVLRADIVIVFDDTNLTSDVYSAENQLSNISAHLEDDENNIVSSNEGDIIFEVTDLDGNVKELKDVGKYIITATINKETTGYQYVLPVTMEYEITPKEVTIEYFAKEESFVENSYEYDQKVKTYIAKVNEIEGYKTIGEYSTSSENVGEYILDASADYSNPNYKLVGENKLTVSITKATLRVDFPNKDKINSDGTITPVFKNLSGDILTNIPYDITYKKGILRPEEKENMLESGRYSVTVDVTETSNYKLSTLGSNWIYNI